MTIWTPLVALPLFCLATEQPAAAPSGQLIEEMVAVHGEKIRGDLERGLGQVESQWSTEDGDGDALREFVRQHFAADPATRDALFERSERIFEQLDGLLLDAGRELRMHVDLDSGPILPFDQILADSTLDPPRRRPLRQSPRVRDPAQLSADQPRGAPARGRDLEPTSVAEARLADRFSARVPAAIRQRISQADAAASSYVSGYNIWMHHLVERSNGRAALSRPE